MVLCRILSSVKSQRNNILLVIHYRKVLALPLKKSQCIRHQTGYQDTTIRTPVQEAPRTYQIVIQTNILHILWQKWTHQRRNLRLPNSTLLLHMSKLRSQMVMQQYIDMKWKRRTEDINRAGLSCHQNIANLQQNVISSQCTQVSVFRSNQGTFTCSRREYKDL